MNIGRAIKELRLKKDFNQKLFAEAIGISQTSLSQIESGGSKPSDKTMKRICSELQISEALLYLLALEQSDIPEDRRSMYEALYPLLKGMIYQLTGPINI